MKHTHNLQQERKINIPDFTYIFFWTESRDNEYNFSQRDLIIPGSSLRGRYVLMREILQDKYPSPQGIRSILVQILSEYILKDILRRETFHDKHPSPQEVQLNWWQIFSRFKLHALRGKLRNTEEEVSEVNKPMGSATQIGRNRALLDFYNRLLPYITEKRFCGKVIYGGGDDFMAIFTLEDLPKKGRWQFLLEAGGRKYIFCPLPQCLKPLNLFMKNKKNMYFETYSARNTTSLLNLLNLFMGIPSAFCLLPPVSLTKYLLSLGVAWCGGNRLCFRVIYGGRSTLESWYELVNSPCEELPRRTAITKGHQLFSKAAQVIMNRRDESKKLEVFPKIGNWFNKWVLSCKKNTATLMTKPENLGNVLCFSTFWTDKMVYSHLAPIKFDVI